MEKLEKYKLPFFVIFILAILIIPQFLTQPEHIKFAPFFRWGTYFRLGFIIVYTIINHQILIPQYYLAKRYIAYFSILIACLIFMLAFPEIVDKPPQDRPPRINDPHELPIPPFMLVIGNMFLLFFISTIVSITIKTRQFLEEVNQQHEDYVKTLKNDSKNESVNEGIVAKTQIDNALLATVNYGVVRIEYEDILFLKGVGNYIQFHLKDKKPILIRMTMKEALDKLPSEKFIRVHKSYIVALKAIENTRNKVIYIDDQEIPIGKAYEGHYFNTLSK